MPTREIIEQTMQNMEVLYQDISEIINIVENKMKAIGFTPLGDAACTWDVSTAYYSPELWLLKWFARVYRKDTLPLRAVGFCLHLGAHGEEWENELAGIGVHLPAVNVSGIEFLQEVVSLQRSDVLNSFWSAGWTNIKN